MIAAVLLLFAVQLQCSDAVAAQCNPSREVECFDPADYLNASGPVTREVCCGKKLSISLKSFSGNPVCHWSRGADPKLTVNGKQSMDLPELSETDSGEYTLSCETSNETSSSVKVSLHVLTNRPMKPRLTLENLGVRLSSPDFLCVSEGCPRPILKFPGSNKKVKTATNGILTSTSYFHVKGMMCCANNSVGQECSQLYDYDLDSDIMKSDEVSNVTVSPGDTLLLRCRIKMVQAPSPVWAHGGHLMNTATLACSPKVKKEICTTEDSHSGSQMAYLSIESVNLNHSGTYTCSSHENTTKSVYIHVQAESFLSAQLDTSIIMSAQAASSSCLRANVSYHPVLKSCSWETPDRTLKKCIREENVTKHKTVTYCDPIKSGYYTLHLEAGRNKETKTISVCVVEIPKFKFRVNDDNNTFTIETVSLVPANYTWMTASSTNDSYVENLVWTEIPGVAQTDSDVSCTKTIRSSLSRDLLEGQYLRFCLTNSVGSWCDKQNSVFSRRPQPSTGASVDPDSLMMLKVGSLILLLALAVVSMVLMYFVKNKQKPQYQPQLQMIQMVGPNDNDYIYINFKDFEYNPKWEFPRENLELGKELGSGAFGMVVQATAYGINKPGVSQQVAVKMLKEKHQSVEKEALMSELKMLTHIGHHANIVNLLGACTDTGPTYLIFQYCQYGDLLNYLKKNRELYHKSVTDAFNKDRFNSLYHNLHHQKDSSEGDAAVNNYMPMYPATSRGQEDIALITHCSDTDTAEGPEIFEESDDQIEDLQTLTFDDLLSFAFQVAKGMEFLSSKNCIHRDLAARNVLVTKGRLVKIGDFGLARDIDNDSNYVVRGNVRLPVKWMAPESTFQGIYTMKSDVWAYGILLWEIFSLGVTPYPGMKVDHTFYSMIERGFKMECPYYADESVYGMMCKCWALNPCDRPTFSKLVSFMCDQLTDREEKLYHNMLDQTSTDYQNAPDILAISALAEQNENKTQSANEYSRTFSTEERKPEACDAEEKLLKPPDTE